MGKLTINNADNYEHLCNVKLTKDKYPIAFQHKVDELMFADNTITKEMAENMVADMEIELEVYYQEGYGLFAVESDFCECTDEMFSPYNGERIPYESDRF